MQDIFDDILMRIAPKRTDALEMFGGSYPDNVVSRSPNFTLILCMPVSCLFN